MSFATPKTSIVICTYNRAAHAVTVVESALANTYPDFDVILVDQSTNQETFDATRRFCADERFHYIATPTIGAGRSRNIGLQHAQTDIIALTDDDCILPPNWLEVMTAVFDNKPDVAVVFCNVIPGQHDPIAGFIPSYIKQRSKLIQTMWDKCDSWGLCAGMALRRAPILQMGGFDESMGPGGRFPSADDEDIAMRTLLHGWSIYETDEVSVIHEGFRTWKEGVELTKRDWLGLGAAYAKPLKCGHWRSAVVAIHRGFVVGLLHAFLPIFSWQRPQGFRRFIYFCQGFAQGLATPVDRQKILYR